MAQLTKDWLTIDYTGEGNGVATFVGSANAGTDSRAVEVSFVDASRTVVVTRRIRQAGAPTLTETYTMLTYIEATGEQYFDSGYIVKETDIIEMDYISMKASSADKMLYGAVGSGTAVWFSVYNQTGYVRFGQSSSTQVGNIQTNYRLTAQKGKIVLGDTATTLTYAGEMPDNTLVLFSNHLASGGISSAKAEARSSYFRIKDADGNYVINMHAAKRDSDGVAGFLDLVSGNFYASESGVDFLAGNEAQIPAGYELEDYVTFTADKGFDAGVIDSTMAIEVMYKRSESTATPYLYGVITSPHTATVSAYMASGGAWRWGSSSKTIRTNNAFQHRVQVKNGEIIFDVTKYTFTKNDFATPDTLIVGGYRSSGNTIYKNYKGKIYYFRVTDGGNLVHDWLPCRRIADNVVGFWDCATQEFVAPISSK